MENYKKSVIIANSISSSLLSPFLAGRIDDTQVDIKLTLLLGSNGRRAYFSTVFSQFIRCFYLYSVALFHPGSAVSGSRLCYLQAFLMMFVSFQLFCLKAEWFVWMILPLSLLMIWVQSTFQRVSSGTILVLFFKLPQQLSS